MKRLIVREADRRPAARCDAFAGLKVITWSDNGDHVIEEVPS
jgi:hypothetical protein